MHIHLLKDISRTLGISFQTAIKALYMTAIFLQTNNIL